MHTDIATYSEDISRLMLVNPHTEDRNRLATALQTLPATTIAAEISSGQEALELIGLVQLDAVVIELNLPDMDGVVLAKTILQKQPTARVLILANKTGPERMHDALRAGVKGYVFKESGITEIVSAIQSVIGGERRFDALPNGAEKLVRIVHVDDHPLVRDGLRTRLQSVPHFALMGEAGSGQEALEIAARLQPDVMLVDISMKDINGIRLTARIHEISPQTVVLILSMYDNSEYVVSAMRAGAKGYVLKDAGFDEIIVAIDAVAKGGTYFSASVAHVLLNQSTHEEPLTEREREVLILLATGHSNKSVAQQLDVGVRTVETHRLNLRRKLGIDSSAGLVRYALDKGWIQV